jgi:hypothetical protein
MRLLIIILPLFVTQILFGQNSIDTTSVLSLQQKTNYKEASKFWRDNDIVLWQEVTFNDPNIIDDEYSQILSISILDSAIVAGQRLFNLVNDSAIVKCTYDRLSPWNWSKKIIKTVGQLKIISLTKNRIETEFDLIITEQGKGIYIYQGKRVFKKSKPLITKTVNLE